MHVLRTSLVQDTEAHSKGVIPRPGQKKGAFPAQGLWPESLASSHRNPSPTWNYHSRIQLLLVVRPAQDLVRESEALLSCFS